MISTNNVSLSFGGRKLFEEVSIKFNRGNCYGLIGANGAGKSTFIKILSGDIEAQTGTIEMKPGSRLSVLKQDHFAFDEYTVMHTVIKGNPELFEVMIEKEFLYAKPEMTDDEGMRASELEVAFAEMNGWEAESEAATLLAGLGIGTDLHDKKMKDLNGSEKVKVLLVQALFGEPDTLLLDEPTNHLDIDSIKWLEDFLLNFKNTVVVVSHDRHFLNKVCTHIADIDFGKITSYAGNYDFWKQSSELALHLRSNQKKKQDEKVKELKDFIQRFSANASKSKQATSRQKQLEKLELVDLPRSIRKYPYVFFDQKRESGKDMLRVEGISKTIEGVKIIDNLSFSVNKGEKVVFLGDSDLVKTTLFNILMGEMELDSGTVEWGVTTSRAYLPDDNSQYFESGELSIVDWLRQYSPDDQSEEFIRGFLGKMLFSGEEAIKKTNVLSGGERVRCMLSKMMLSGANVLIIDGPTNHLDLESISAFNEGLIRYNGTILFSSHDHDFVQTVANRIIVLSQGVLVDDQSCSYEEYIKNKA